MPISWTAYASIDNTLETGTDIVVGSGTTPYSGLNSGTSYTFNNITGNWPSAGTYYLFINLANPGDETITGNNSGLNGPYNVKDPPDYIISSSTYQLDGDSNTPLSNYGTFDFVITENAGVNGSQPIEWEVFVSTNESLDVNDVSIKSGNINALSASSSSSTISYADAVWPVFGSYYYIIISIDSGDDDNTANNTYVTPTFITVPEGFNGNTINSSNGPQTGAPASFQDLTPFMEGGTLDQMELVKVTDIMDDDNKYYDTFKIVLGADVTTLDMYAQWSNGQGTIDLYFWDESNHEESYLVYFKDRKPELGFFTLTDIEGFGLTPGVPYYVGVRFTDFNGNDLPYELYLRAR